MTKTKKTFAAFGAMLVAFALVLVGLSTNIAADGPGGSGSGNGDGEQYYVSAGASQNGTVSGVGFYAKGTKATFTFTANQGYVIKSASVSGAVVPGATGKTSASYTTTVNSDLSLSVVCEKATTPNPEPQPQPNPEPQPQPQPNPGHNTDPQPQPQPQPNPGHNKPDPEKPVVKPGSSQTQGGLDALKAGKFNFKKSAPAPVKATTVAKKTQAPVANAQPQVKAPQTGDNGNVALYLAGAIASVVAVAGIFGRKLIVKR